MELLLLDHWLLFDKYNQTLQELDFISMGDDGRVFKQGRLVFNNEKAILLLDKVYDFRTLQDDVNSIIQYILTNFT